MSLPKVLLTLFVSGALIFVLLLYITLKDYVTDVSDQEPYAALINKPLTLSRDILLIRNNPALSKFAPDFLSETTDSVSKKTSLVAKVPKGNHLTIQKFMTVKNGRGGFITWYAVGKIFQNESKGEVDFEYAWPRGYSFLETEYLAHSTPPWVPCPFNDDIKAQSIAALGKTFKDVVWDADQEKAVVMVSPSETLRLSTGGCLRRNWIVSLETTEGVSLEDLEFWNKSTNWIFENVFTEEKERFSNALLEKKVEYDSSLSDEHRRIYTFAEAQSDTRNNYLGIEISEKGRVKKIEMMWYLDEAMR